MHNHIRHVLVAASLVTVTSTSQCPTKTDFCTDPDSTFGIPLLDLSPGSPYRPTIDGAIEGNGYSSFLELPMFNGGKNGDSGSPFDQEGRIGTAYLAYDHVHKILCAAAFLDPAFLTDRQTSSIEVVESDDDSWIQFGSGLKLKESNADQFDYVAKQVDSYFTIGYEGCWDIDTSDDRMTSILNNYVQVHFNRIDMNAEDDDEKSKDKRMLNDSLRNGGETTSTGKAATGRLICLTPSCNFSSRPITSSPIRRPTNQPNTSSPSRRPSNQPNTSSPSVRPSNQPNTSSPSVRPSNQPNTSSPSVRPSNQPNTSSPSRRPTNQPNTSSPSRRPSNQPNTSSPSSRPTNQPNTSSPSRRPTNQPNTSSPSSRPSNQPNTSSPSSRPSNQPNTSAPSVHPSNQPNPSSPSVRPSSRLIESPLPTSPSTNSPSSRPTLSTSPTCDYTTIDAINNEVTTPVNTPIDIKVLDNDMRATDQSPLDIASILFSGNHGQCFVGDDGETITYTPNTDYYGTDTCIYTTCDSKHRCDSAAIIIYVTPVIANDDVATTVITTPVDIYPLDNDISFAETVLSVASIKDNAQNGECLVMNGQVVVYIPKPNFHGVDSCTYTACVSSGLCASARITITVEGEPCDDKPTRNIELTPRPSLRQTTREPTSKPIPLPTLNPTHKPVTNGPTSLPTNEPTKKPTPDPTQNPTKNPVTNGPTAIPTYEPTKKPTPNPSPTPTKKPSPKPTQQPITSEPTAAPTTCDSRMFHYINGCCTNANYVGSGPSYSTMRDCCNDKFHERCCTFDDVCFHREIDPIAPTPPSPKPTMKPTSNYSGICYDQWEPKYYEPGDKVTASNGKNYQCDADYYLYCAQEAFKPGSGMASELAWNRLPSTCTGTRQLLSKGCTN